MTRRLFVAMLVGATLAGCADAPPSIDEAPGRPTKPNAAASLHVAFDAPNMASRDILESQTCEPFADEGPCSLVCDLGLTRFRGHRNYAAPACCMN